MCHVMCATTLCHMMFMCDMMCSWHISIDVMCHMSHDVFVTHFHRCDRDDVFICHMMCSWHISIDVTEMMCSYVTWCVRDTFQFIFLYTTWTETHLNSRVTAAHSIDVMCHTSNDVFVTHSNSYSYVRHELKRTLPRKSWPQLWTSHVTHLNENRVTNWNAP